MTLGTLRYALQFASQLCLCLYVLAPSVRAADTVVFAAASLKTALDEIVEEYDGRTESKTVVSYLGTPVLARQITQGAPADVIISASPDWMNWLEAENAIESGSRFDFLGNQLVLIQNRQAVQNQSTTATSLLETVGKDRIAMALVDAVPAGIYGKSALISFGAWEELEAQVVQTDNARAALALVAIGAAPFGIVYATDAKAEPRVSVALTFPPESHAKIIYPAAIVAGRATDKVLHFVAHLRSAQAKARFEKHGFNVLGTAP